MEHELRPVRMRDDAYDDAGDVSLCVYIHAYSRQIAGYPGLSSRSNSCGRNSIRSTFTPGGVTMRDTRIRAPSSRPLPGEAGAGGRISCKSDQVELSPKQGHADIQIDL